MTLYQADLSAGSLLPAESRVLAKLLLSGVDVDKDDGIGIHD